MPPRPLDGVRVLDFTWYQQGPYATVILSDYGADVIKVESRNIGDPGRYSTKPPGHDVAPYFIAHSRGKRSVTLDLKEPEGREIILELAERSDVLVHNFRPGVMERLGLGYADLHVRFPRLVYATASAFGTRGPLHKHPGFDIVGQAMGGIMSVTGTRQSGPLPAGAAIADQVGAMTLANAILAALFHRERTGEGLLVDVSLYGSQIALQAWEITQQAITGQASGPGEYGHPLLKTIWGRYDTADGALVIGGLSDARWPRFADALEAPALMDDRFRVARNRTENLDDLNAIVRARIATQPTAVWIERFRAADLIAAPVQSYADIVACEQARANGYLTDLVMHDGASVPIVGSPVNLNGEPLPPNGPPPELGQHTESVLLELGYTWEAISGLRERNVI